MSEIDEKYEKFKLKPLEFLEKLSFINLANVTEVDLQARYIEILLEIQKIKKTMPHKSNQSIV